MSKAANTGNGYPSGMKNRIINGGMDISQRGTSFAAANSYTLDRWFCSNVSDASATVTQSTDVPAGSEFQSSIRAYVDTADTSISSTQRAAFSQSIEGYNVRDLIGRTFTVSFWVRSTKTGIHCVAFRNSISDRSYVTEYTINISNTWEYKTITIIGGLITSGTWNWTNGLGCSVSWFLTAGSSFQTTPGSWQTGNFMSTANQVNVLDTIGNIFAITGVQLELGPVATPFEHRLFGTELALCQSYYRRGLMGGCMSVAYSTANISFRLILNPPARGNVTTALISGASLTNCIEKIGIAIYTPTSSTILTTPANYAQIDFGGVYTLGAPCAIATDNIIEINSEL